MSDFIKRAGLEYSIDMDVMEVTFLTFVLEVTMNRQLNFIAQHKKDLAKIDEKLRKAKEQISTGKQGFFSSDPKLRYNELMNQRENLVESMREPEIDLNTARRLYAKIYNERDRMYPGDGKYIEKEFFEDRENMYVGGRFKNYFKIEHYIY